MIFKKRKLNPNLFILICILCTDFCGCFTICSQNEEFFGPNSKCLPCTICQPPLIVVATCEIYSDTKCGSPEVLFGVRPSLANPRYLLPESNVKTHTTRIKKKKKVYKKHFFKDKRRQKHRKKKLPSYESIDCENGKFCNQIKTDNLFAKDDKPQNQKDDIESFIHTDDDQTRPLTPNISENPKRDTSKILRGTLTTNLLEKETNNTQTTWDSNKVIIAVILGLLDLLLVFVFIILLVLSCLKDHKAKMLPDSAATQKLPNPCQVPIKCRFTAVLPSRSDVQYANIDSSMNTLLRNPSHLHTTLSNGTSTHIASIPRIQECSVFGNAQPPQMYCENNMSNTSIPPVHSGFSPQISNIIDSGLQYLKLPPPNPFTMDRLLENRRTEGNSSVENNLYVETWCRSQSSFMQRPPANSTPALPSIKKSPPASCTSSPMILRTYRATPLEPPGPYGWAPR